MNKTILITGANGFIGSYLNDFLTKRKFTVVKASRETFVDLAKSKKVDHVIHLMGENIASRWSKQKKKNILESRVQSTHLLVNTLLTLKNPPRTFLCASATGYYGDTQDKAAIEDTKPGKTFLANVCKKWEFEAKKAEKKNIRTINMRFSMILGSKGGALSKILLPTKLGLSGSLGSGDQYISWIHIEDLARAVLFILEKETILGPVNFCTENAVTQKNFIKMLAKTLKMPSFFKIPAFLLKLLLGEMAEEMLLLNNRVYPKKLLQEGFSFKYPDLNKSFNQLLREKK